MDTFSNCQQHDLYVIALFQTIAHSCHVYLVYVAQLTLLYTFVLGNAI